MAIPRGNRSGRVRPIMIILVLAAAAAGAWAYVGIVREAPARTLADLVPEDTLAYVALRDVGKLYERQTARARAGDPAFDEAMKTILDELLAEPLKDSGASILEALGGLDDLELALTRFDRSGPTVVARVTADKPVAGWKLYREIETKGLLEKDGEHRGYALFRIKEDLDLGFEGAKHRVFLGLLEKQLLLSLATDASAIKQVIDAATEPLDRSLARESTYKSLFAEAPADYVSWFYVPARPILDRVRALAPPAVVESIQKSEPLHGLSTLIALTGAGWFDGDKSLGWYRLHTAGQTPWMGAARTPASPRKLLAAVPPHAFAVLDLGLGDARELWDRGYAYTDRLIEFEHQGGPDAKARIQRDKEQRDRAVREEFPRELGFSILDGLLPALGDELAVAVFPGDAKTPVHLAFLVAVKDATRVRAIEKGLLDKAFQGIEWDRRESSGLTTAWPAGAETGRVPPIAYGFSDKLFLGASSRETLEACVKALGDGPDLESDPGYRPYLAALPKDLSWVLAVDMGGYLELLKTLVPVGPNAGPPELPFDEDDFKGMRVAGGLGFDDKTLSIHGIAPADQGWSSGTLKKLAQTLGSAHNNLKSARRVRVKMDFEAAKLAADMYKLEKGRYPDSPETLLKEGYLEMGLDPWGNPYDWGFRAGRLYFKSFGPDGAEGGGDDVDPMSIEPPMGPGGPAPPRTPRFGLPVAQEAAAEGALGAVRAGISNFYGKMALPSHEGAARYPTLIELKTPGKVMQHGIPRNPYSLLAGKESEVLDADAARKIKGQSKDGSDHVEGWYYKPSTGEFWLATASGKDL